MTLPKPPATTRKVKSHDDAIAYGIRDLTSFCKSLNAIWILAKATNYVGFTDAQRAECDLSEAAARRRHAGLEAANAATFGIVNVDRIHGRESFTSFLACHVACCHTHTLALSPLPSFTDAQTHVHWRLTRLDVLPVS